MRRSDAARWMLVTLGLAAMAGCMDDGGFGLPGPPGRGTFFECDRGTMFSVTYRRNAAVVRIAGRPPIRLRQVPAASGTAYEGGGYLLREKGGEAMWSGPTREAPQSCRVVPVAR